MKFRYLILALFVSMSGFSQDKKNDGDYIANTCTGIQNDIINKSDMVFSRDVFMYNRQKFEKLNSETFYVLKKRGTITINDKHAFSLEIKKDGFNFHFNLKQNRRLIHKDITLSENHNLDVTYVDYPSTNYPFYTIYFISPNADHPKIPDYFSLRFNLEENKRIFFTGYNCDFTQFEK